MSKGYKRRPRQVSRGEFDRRWNETFGDQKELINPDQGVIFHEPDGPKQLELPFEFWPYG